MPNPSPNPLPVGQIPLSPVLLGDQYPRLSYDTINSRLLAGDGTTAPNLAIVSGSGGGAAASGWTVHGNTSTPQTVTGDSASGAWTNLGNIGTATTLTG